MRESNAGNIGGAKTVAVVEVGRFEGRCNAGCGRTIRKERVEEDGGVERARQGVVL